MKIYLIKILKYFEGYNNGLDDIEIIVKQTKDEIDKEFKKAYDKYLNELGGTCFIEHYEFNENKFCVCDGINSYMGEIEEYILN